MTSGNSATFGIFPTPAAAGMAVDRLATAGFSNQDVSLLLSDKGEWTEFAAETNTLPPKPIQGECNRRRWSGVKCVCTVQMAPLDGLFPASLVPKER